MYGRYINILTDNYDYSRSNKETFTATHGNAIIWKIKIILRNLITFLKSTLIFEHFQKKKKKIKEPHSSSTSEVIDSERLAYLNA